MAHKDKEINPFDEEASEKFNMGVASVQRMNNILNLVHEHCFYALEGDYNAFFSWKTWLVRYYMECFILLKDKQKQTIDDNLKEIDKELEIMNRSIHSQEKNTRIKVNTALICNKLIDTEKVMRQGTEELIFPKEDDSARHLR